MSSQQLVRKLLRATEDADGVLVPPATGNGKKKSASSAPRQEQNKKRKRRGEEDEAAVEMTEDQIVDWHVQTLILGLDRKMAARGSRNSNATAIGKSLRRLEQRQVAKTGVIQPPGSGCGRTSAAQKKPEPTFNKKRYEAEKKQKKLAKLRRALKTLDKEDKKKKKKST